MVGPAVCQTLTLCIAGFKGGHVMVRLRGNRVNNVTDTTMTPELIDAIRQRIERGHKQADIKKEVLAAGHDEATFDAAYAKAQAAADAAASDTVARSAAPATSGGGAGAGAAETATDTPAAAPAAAGAAGTDSRSATDTDSPSGSPLRVVLLLLGILIAFVIAAGAIVFMRPELMNMIFPQEPVAEQPTPTPEPAPAEPAPASDSVLPGADGDGASGAADEPTATNTTDSPSMSGDAGTSSPGVRTEAGGDTDAAAEGSVETDQNEEAELPTPPVTPSSP